MKFGRTLSGSFLLFIFVQNEAIPLDSDDTATEVTEIDEFDPTEKAILGGRASGVEESLVSSAEVTTDSNLPRSEPRELSGVNLEDPNNLNIEYIKSSRKIQPKIRFTEVPAGNPWSDKPKLWKWIGIRKGNKSSVDFYFEQDILVVGEDVKEFNSILLECVAPFPISWKHDGLKRTPDIPTNFYNISFHPNGTSAVSRNFSMTLVLGQGGFLKSKDRDSGNYSCAADEEMGDGNKVSSVYVFVPDNYTANPCTKNPCGLNAVCEVRHGNKSCSCLDHYVGNPLVKCRPECSLNSDCREEDVCVQSKCVNICETYDDPPSINECYSNQNKDKELVKSRDSQDDPNENVITNARPCTPSTCGENAYCEEKYRKTLAICHCLDNHFGDPWTTCHGECLRREHCPTNLTCIQGKCEDPCLIKGACGQGSICQVVEHRTNCSCPEDHTGNPYRICHVVQEELEGIKGQESTEETVTTTLSI